MRRFALVMALAGIGWSQTAGAQVVKAPRYGQTPVDAPVQQLNLPPLPTAITPHGTVVEDIVVRINDQIISRSDVERQQLQLQQAIAQGGVPPAEAATEQKNMLRDMIDQQLLLSKAKELGLNADAELVRRLDEIRKQNKLESLDDLAKAAQQQGVNYEDFKAQQKNQILTQMVVRDEVGRKIQMSPTDAKKYYDAHLEDFTQPEQVHLSEIIIPTPENASAEQVAQAEAKANDVRSMALKGGDFADLAKKYSGGTSAAQGGELGQFKPGALPKVFEDAAFPLKTGELTQPIRSRQGFVILKVIEHQAAGPAPIKDVENQIEEAMYMQQMQPKLREFLTKLRTDAYVDIQPGFVDSGGVPSETKSILNTAYAPPPVKKKVVKQTTVTRFDRSGRPLAAKSVVASPDTTGTRTITGADAVVATPPASGIDQTTGLAKISAPKANGKQPKMAKREKIRFGQAPRNSLSGGAEDSVGSEGGTSSAALTPAPGAVMASNGTMPTESANLQDNPLTERTPEHAKTRFAAKAAEVKENKVKTVSAKQQEKVAAKAEPMTPEEAAAAKIQSAPLGLSGDTTKKQPKPKKVKGATKERLEDKPVAPKAVAPPVDQTASPTLAPTSVTPAPATPPPS